MASATQDGKLLKLASIKGKDFFLITDMYVREGLNQLFSIEIDAFHEDPEDAEDPTVVDPKELIGDAITVSVNQEGNIVRYFNGMCIGFTQNNNDPRYTSYRIELAPHAWLLTQRRQSRIFQQKSVRDILEIVLDGFKYSLLLQGNYQPRNYCVQYNETDWEFASRLMEEEGIFYYFKHEDGRHTLVLGDTPQGHHDCPSKNTLPFKTDIKSLEAWTGAITSWGSKTRLRSGKVTYRDYSFQLPNSDLECTKTTGISMASNTSLEVYEYPGYYAKQFDGIDPSGGEQAGELNMIPGTGRTGTSVRQDELDSGVNRSYGTSNCCSLTAGHRFELKEHPIKEYNCGHVLVTVEVQAKQSPGYASDQPVDDPYVVAFTSIFYGEGKPPFRPPLVTPKPMVYGSQTATVVGVAGEEIFTDKYGRVKVQFHWDRQGRMDNRSSCWVRVAQSSAGNAWGSMFIPRKGMEVIVDFLEGDPDQPIITGCVYNAQMMPAYKLPDEKTKSYIKTDSSKGGGGFNELRFEDLKGQEQIFIHAQKNLDMRVLNDVKQNIKKDHHLTVQNDKYETIKGNKHGKLTGDKKEQVDGSVSCKVGRDYQIKTSGKYAVDAAQEIHLKAGLKTIIEAGMQLTIKAGSGFVDIGPSGVTISGPMVLINSGGAAGTGSGSSPDSPKDAVDCDDANEGKSAADNPPPNKPDKFSPKAQTMASAANSGVPFASPASSSASGPAPSSSPDAPPVSPVENKDAGPASSGSPTTYSDAPGNDGPLSSEDKDALEADHGGSGPSSPDGGYVDPPDDVKSGGGGQSSSAGSPSSSSSPSSPGGSLSSEDKDALEADHGGSGGQSSSAGSPSSSSSPSSPDGGYVDPPEDVKSGGGSGGQSSSGGGNSNPTGPESSSGPGYIDYDDHKS